jgi:hypothetical protein
MGDAKDQFLKDSDLAGRWSAFVNGPDSGKVFAFADGELINNADLTPEQIRGARAYKEILKNLATVPEPPPEPITSGLRHDIDPRPRTPKLTAQLPPPKLK